MKSPLKKNRLNSWCFILIISFFFQFRIANNSADSILLSIQTASSEDKPAIWEAWLDNPSKDNITSLWDHAEQIYIDAEQVMKPDDVKDW